MQRFFVSVFTALCLLLAVPNAASAADAKQLLQLQLDASKRAVSGDLQGAISMYDQIIALTPQKPDAYLERGLLYRELGDSTRSMADAAYALKLVEYWMGQGKNTSKVYYQRATANRLLKKFDLAEQDMRVAISKDNSMKYKDDLQAIILESKMK